MYVCIYIYIYIHRRRGQQGVRLLRVHQERPGQLLLRLARRLLPINYNTISNNTI